MMLRIDTRLIDEIAVMDCHGRIVFGDESSALYEAATGMLEKTNNLVLNLSGVNYIDSGGLGALVSIYTYAKSSGANVRLANLTQRVRDLLQITKLVTVFDVHGSEQEALKAFGRSAAA